MISMIRAIVSRRFSWRIMILAACCGFAIWIQVMGWREYPWVAVPFVVTSIVVLHPIMDKDLPSLIGLDMLKSWRTYVAVALNIVAVLLSNPIMKAFQDRSFNGR